MLYAAGRQRVTRQKQREAPYFRWQALEWFKRASAALAAITIVGVIALLVYSGSLSSHADASGRPHNLAPFALFARPTSTPTAQPISPTSVPTPVIPRLGIVSGHHGNDSGAVCRDGLTEAQVNYDIASRVATEMRQRGYTVDVLDEFDPRLNGYRALLLLSIHADS
jgi:N-acetylmuramoyl-L-alanine amidase